MHKTPLRERARTYGDWSDIALFVGVIFFMGMVSVGISACGEDDESSSGGNDGSDLPVVAPTPEATRITLLDVVGPGNNIEVYEYFTSRGDFCTVTYTYPGYTSTACDWIEPEEHPQ